MLIATSREVSSAVLLLGEELVEVTITAVLGGGSGGIGQPVEDRVQGRCFGADLAGVVMVAAGVGEKSAGRCGQSQGGGAQVTRQWDPAGKADEVGSQAGDLHCSGRCDRSDGK